MEKELERLADALEKHTDEDKAEFGNIHKHIESIKDDLVKQISTKVSKQLFWTVIPLMLTFVGAMFMFSVSEIRNSKQELREDIGALSSIVIEQVISKQ